MPASRFDWDTSNLDHIARHRVGRGEAESVLGDAVLRWTGIEMDQGEWRAEFVGQARTGRIIVVAITPRGEQLRIVTACPARGQKLRRCRQGGTA